MKAFYKLNLVILLLFLASCGNSNYWEISKFNISDGILSPKEEVKVLYYSGGKVTFSHQTQAYIHLIVVSKNTGDTINILSKPPEEELTTQELQKNLYYYDKNTIEYKKFGIPKAFSETLEPEDWKIFRDAKREKVYRDSRFDEISDNHYPTIIGCVLPNK